MSVLSLALTKAVRARMKVDGVYTDATPTGYKLSFTTPSGHLLTGSCKDIITDAIKEQFKQSPSEFESVESCTWAVANKSGEQRKQYNRFSITVINSTLTDDGASGGKQSGINFSAAKVRPGSHRLTCQYCGNTAKFSTESNFLYFGRDFGPVYFCTCKPTGVYVGCHKGTSNPLGIMADDELRVLRKKCHALFDPLWQWVEDKKDRNKQRAEMYKLLAEQMNITVSECHFSHFNNESCEVALSVLESGKLAKNLPALVQIKVAMSSKRRV